MPASHPLLSYPLYVYISILISYNQFKEEYGWQVGIIILSVIKLWLAGWVAYANQWLAVFDS
jgi:hypothetical protein